VWVTAHFSLHPLTSHRQCSIFRSIPCFAFYCTVAYVAMFKISRIAIHFVVTATMMWQWRRLSDRTTLLLLTLSVLIKY